MKSQVALLWFIFYIHFYTDTEDLKNIYNSIYKNSQSARFKFTIAYKNVYCPTIYFNYYFSIIKIYIRLNSMPFAASEGESHPELINILNGSKIKIVR